MMLNQVKAVVSEDSDGQPDSARPQPDSGRVERTERLLKSVDHDSAVGWTPGVTDWLTGKSRLVGSRGM